MDLERICMFTQQKKNVYDLIWNNEGVTIEKFFINQKKNFQHIILNMLILKIFLRCLICMKVKPIAS